MNKKSTTGIERIFDSNDLIVSKTNIKGHITYANRVFLDLAGYPTDQVIGAPHSLVRHPEMPRCIFKFMWDTIKEQNKEIFAYVVNRSANGDHYWVFAHVTPSFGRNGDLEGFHSNRRAPNRKVLNEKIIPLYQTLLDEEARHSNRKEGMNAALSLFMNTLQKTGKNYDEFIFSL